MSDPLAESDHSLAARWLDEVRPPAYSIPAELVGGNADEWVEVVRLDRLREAVSGAAYPPGQHPADHTPRAEQGGES